jgi:phage baseplate assembly protein W
MGSDVYKSLGTGSNATKDGGIFGLDVIRESLRKLFTIRKGTVPMQPNLGSIAWDYLFEPELTEYDKSLIERDSIELITNYEPRVIAESVTIGDYDGGYYIVVSVTEKLSQETIDLRVEFNE